MELLYKKKIAKILECDTKRIFLYWKGRVALYNILKAMECNAKSEVIVPGLTCVVVPNAIKYLGAIPKYADINKKTLTPSLEKIIPLISNNTKAIIIQNTFGLSTDLEDIIEYAKKNNIYTIEDCTHGFGGTYNDKPNGSYCDAAFYSTQWNKPFSTGIGGFSLINNDTLLSKVTNLHKALLEPGLKDKLILQQLIFAKDKLLSDWNYWLLLEIYRFFGRIGLVIGSSSREETSDIIMPKNYNKGISKVQIKYGEGQITKLSLYLAERKMVALNYSKMLSKNDKFYVGNVLTKNHSFLKYPILVKDRENFIRLAQKNRIRLSDWFLSPIHPVRKNYNRWNLSTKSIPVASEISHHLVALSTEHKDFVKTVDFISNNMNLLI